MHWFFAFGGETTISSLSPFHFREPAALIASVICFGIHIRVDFLPQQTFSYIFHTHFIPHSLHLLRHLRLDIHDVNLHSVAILTVEV
jgi:hypothetical protein